MDLPLAPSDEPNRYCIQLYHRTATQADLSGKQALEVSRGHGGGAAYLVRTLRPASYMGLNFNPDGTTRPVISVSSQSGLSKRLQLTA